MATTAQKFLAKVQKARPQTAKAVRPGFKQTGIALPVAETRTSTKQKAVVELPFDWKPLDAFKSSS